MQYKTRNLKTYIQVKLSKMSVQLPSLPAEPSFVIYREGNALQLKCDTMASDVWLTAPAIRLCVIDEQRLLLLTCAQRLLLGQSDHKSQQLVFSLLHSDVVDVDYCRSTRTLYIVTANGGVYAQVVDGERIPAKQWQQISFDPLELSEEGICVARVKCSSEGGVLFVTSNSELYALGSCGDVFQSTSQPQRLRLFGERKEILDLVAGDEHFAVLLKPQLGEDVPEGCEMFFKKVVNRAASTASHASRLQQRSSPQRDLLVVSNDVNVRKHQRQPSSSSVNSLSSQISNSQYSSEENSVETLQHLLRQGYALLCTEVHTFGNDNKGLLGTGDHIKRSTVGGIQKLEGIAICSIAAGREHTIARTLDGRLFHWGLNSKQQLNGKRDCLDLSAPTELKIDAAELSALECTVLAACCGDYQTILLNAKGDLSARNASFKNDLLHLQTVAVDEGKKMAPMLLAAGCYTLQNQRHPLRQPFYVQLNSLQLQLQAMLLQRPILQALQTLQQKSKSLPIKQLVYICQSFVKLMYYLTAALKSLDSYYRRDLENAAELLFIRYSRTSIAIFEDYTRTYCDLCSVNTFVEAGKVFAHFANSSLNNTQATVVDLERIFLQPFYIYSNFVQCLELICKSHIEFSEQLVAWQSYSRQQRIDLELAKHTQEFWLRNERSVKLHPFRHKQRRVILCSETLPLRLTNSPMNISSVTQPIFILFSDFLCQYGTPLQTFPLVAMWLKLEKDKTLRVITPERSFTLMARTHHDKMLWYEQLESAIMAALGKPGAKMSSGRTMAYVYGAKHAKYAGVDAYGQWRNGVLHGSCYLQFPDERFYLGEVRNGEIEGYGKMIIPSIGLYEGNFKAGKFHGNGSYEMKDNELYTGNFRDGLFHGHAMLRTSIYTYVGEFQANAKSGYGILDDAVSGDKYMGMFADNKRTGAGTCITMSGDYFEGIFVNDELVGQGIAAFENDYYYEGELTLHGPMGKGTYYMPHGIVECEQYLLQNSNLSNDDDSAKYQKIGNVLSGQLTGSWNDVRVVAGTVTLNRQFPKFPNSIGDLVVDNSRKWRSLFDNFEEEILSACAANTETTFAIHSNQASTKELWSCIAVYMTTHREREKTLEQQDFAYQSYKQSNFAKNISMGFSASLDKISLKSTQSLMVSAKSSILDLRDDTARLARQSHSQETLFDLNEHDLDYMNSATFHSNEENSFHSLLNAQLGNWANDSSCSLRSSFDSVLNLSNNSKNNSFTSQNDLDFVPNFGITSLNAEDITAIKEYLVQAFKDSHHPLHLLNQRIANSFYTSYGCWKVKPTPILAKQAMREWESISKRVYRFVRKLFPALPEDYCVIEGTRELVSHITLLYPIVLSEGIYSTLFVLYANKYNAKDEMYRHNLLFAEKLNDKELSECLGLDSVLLPVVSNEHFYQAIETLKQVQEKYSPKAMLTVIEKCMQLITEAHKLAECENYAMLAADSMMPLTLFLVLRAAVPHLGAELALLDDLTGGSNFQIEMNGFAGYCYTTLKASYEHITAALLKKM